jgi:hypothetical protein
MQDYAFASESVLYWLFRTMHCHCENICEMFLKARLNTIRKFYPAHAKIFGTVTLVLRKIKLSLYTTRRHRGNWGITPLIPNRCWIKCVDKFTARHFITGEWTPVPTEQEAGWAPEKMWMLLRRERYSDPSWNRTSDCSVRSLVILLKNSNFS